MCEKSRIWVERLEIVYIDLGGIVIQTTCLYVGLRAVEREHVREYKSMTHFLKKKKRRNLKIPKTIKNLGQLLSSHVAKYLLNSILVPDFPSMSNQKFIEFNKK